MDAPSFCDRVAGIGQRLKAAGYHFHTPSPLTHARVLARQAPGPDILQDLFGWNRPVIPGETPQGLRDILHDPELFFPLDDGRYRARMRFSELGPLLLAHSPYPTDQPEAVFLGPDTYRFAGAIRALRERETNFAPVTCLDIGAGTGAGGLYCATLFPGLEHVALLDINDHALGFAAANIALNGITSAFVHRSDILQAWPGPADLIVSNPPYLADPALRAYRHGGGDWGTSLSVRILADALPRLTRNGHLLLYTGSAIVGGRDMFLENARAILEDRTVRYRYEELDPDVFGEELEGPPYNRADRIAIVLLHVKGSDLKR